MFKWVGIFSIVIKNQTFYWNKSWHSYITEHCGLCSKKGTTFSPSHLILSDKMLWQWTSKPRLFKTGEQKYPLTVRWDNFELDCKPFQHDYSRVKIHASKVQNKFCMKSWIEGPRIHQPGSTADSPRFDQI